MARRRVRAPAAAAATALALLLTSCSSGDETSPEASDTGTAAGDTGTPSDGATDAPSDPETSTDTASEDWAAVEAAAQEEGTVTFYCATSQVQCEDVANAFTEDIGIDVEVFRALPGELLAKIQTEQETGAPGADVVYAPDRAMYEALEDYLAPLPTPLRDDPAFDYDEWTFNDRYAIPSLYPVGFAWNTELTDLSIESFEDLLDPSLAGEQIGMPDPADANALAAYYRYIENVAGEGFLEELAAQDPLFISGGSSATRTALIAGEVSALGYTSTNILDEIEAGAPAAFSLPDEPFGVSLYTASLAESPHPNAGSVFVNWLLGPGGGEVMAQDQAVTRSDIPDALVPDPSVVQPDHLLPEWSAEEYEAYVQELNEIFGR